jgi:hypothetical protein
MTANQTNILFESRGIEFVVNTLDEVKHLQVSMQKHLEALQLWQHVDAVSLSGNGAYQCAYRLKENSREQWAPHWDTTRLYCTMGIDSQKKVITLLPASRQQELKYILPVIFAAAKGIDDAVC